MCNAVQAITFLHIRSNLNMTPEIQNVTQNINRFFVSLWRSQFLCPEEPSPEVIAEATVMAMFTGHSSREPSHRHTDSASFAWSLGPGVISSLSFAGLFVFVPANPICYGESTSATYCTLPKGKMLNIDRAWF